MTVVQEDSNHVQTTQWLFQRGDPVVDHWEQAALPVSPGQDSRVGIWEGQFPRVGRLAKDSTLGCAIRQGQYPMVGRPAK